jgi:hypothetical protein
MAQLDARGVLEKGLQAQGGADTLAKYPAIRIKAKGIVEVQGNYLPCTLELTAQLPDRFKSDLRFEVEGKKFALVQGINGDRAWRSMNGKIEEAKDKLLTHMKEGLHGQLIAAFPFVVRDQHYTLSLLPESKVRDRTVLGVRVASAGHREINLYFDKETGFLAKSEHLSPDPDGKDVLRESYFEDYKDGGAVKHWMKLTINRNGKKAMEGNVIEVKLVDQIDAAEFTRP